jgi:GNAT superfamily N-acetyltransferase
MSETQIARPLLDGVRLRPAGAEDQPAVRDFLAGLSPQTAYRRFFAGIGSPSSAFVRHLLTSGDDRGAWVAERAGRVVGHAFWACPPGRADVAELAVVVADELQGRGVGSPLVRLAAMDAAAAGAGRLVLHVLTENRPVLAMVTRRWPDAAPRRDGPHAVFEVPLPAVLSAARTGQPVPLKRGMVAAAVVRNCET